MDKPQAVATLRQALAALFPYPNTGDDPDERRAADQHQFYEAVDVLAGDADAFGKLLPSLTACTNRLGDGGDGLPAAEAVARLCVIKLCAQVTRDYGHEVGAEAGGLNIDDGVFNAALGVYRLPEPAPAR